MTDKELRKLRRDDLLQILINQQRQIDELNEALKKAQDALADRTIAIQESGSLAEAALKLNGVYEAAQAAADQYLEQMRAQADEARSKAQAEADKARRVAEDVLTTARGEADRILREARAQADQMKSQASAGAPAQPPASEAPQAEEEKRRGLFRRNKRA